MALLLFSSTFQTSPRAFAPPPAPCVLASPFWDRRRIHSILPYITPGWGGTRRERETRHTCIIPDWHLLPSETRSCWLMGLHGLWKGRACDLPPQPKGISSTRLPGHQTRPLSPPDHGRRIWRPNVHSSAAGPTSQLEKALLQALVPNRCQILSVTAAGSMGFFPPSICNSHRTLQQQRLSQSVARLFPPSPPAFQRVSIIAHFSVILKQIKC